MFQKFVQLYHQSFKLKLLTCEVQRHQLRYFITTSAAKYGVYSSPSKESYDLRLDVVYDIYQQSIILKVINEHDLDALRCYDIAKSRGENIIKHRKKNGPFRKLEDLLEIDGFGTKFLYKFCNSILQDSAASKDVVNDVEAEPKSLTSTTRRRRIKLCDVSPPSDMKANIKNVVALKFHPTVITWSHVDHEIKAVVDWNGIWPQHRRLVYDHSHNMIWARAIYDQLPKADAYLFERRDFDRKPTSGGSFLTNTRAIVQIEATLLAMLSEDRLFAIDTNQLRKYCSAKCGMKLADVVQQIVEDRLPVSIESSLRQRYMDFNETTKNLMAECLLRTLAFYDTELSS